ncbi:MAG: AAA family ATPase [Lachnospiraceae bacterium]|jgi:predicted ATPase|nr:AAA family ATPase [Lachnospiraceae bacterium]
MIYLSSFLFSDQTVRNPNIYPYHVFASKAEKVLLFRPITILYGNNASGKSTMLNIIANKLKLEGLEYATSNMFGTTPYFMQFINECQYSLGEDEEGTTIAVPKGSRYIKSEDILYEIKKIQQEQILQDGYIYEHIRRGMPKEQREHLKDSYKMKRDMECLVFAQEKYSNGETTLQMLEDYLEPDALYLLDEPEVSLSPANQVALAEELNKMTRFLGCQFIIATHSPFMLATLNAKIYDLDSGELEEKKWTELANVRYFYEFFRKHKEEFEEE